MSDINLQEQEEALNFDTEKGNFQYPEDYKYDAGVGLNEETIKYISDVKEEDDWLRAFRLKALEIFRKKPMPTKWADKDLENIDFDQIRYYLSKGQQPSRTWDEVPDDVKKPLSALAFLSRSANSLLGSRLSSTPKQLTRAWKKI